MNIVEKKHISPKEVKNIIQTGPIVTEIQTWGSGSLIASFRMESRDGRVIVVSVGSIDELVEVVEDEEAE